MSQDEQLMAMGRALSEYAEVRKKLAALYSQTERAGNALERIVWYLVPRDSYHSNSIRSGSVPPDLADFPTADSLRQLISETIATQKRKKELQATLKEFGSEPKD